jgi:hypothetical protein
VWLAHCLPDHPRATIGTQRGAIGPRSACWVPTRWEGPAGPVWLYPYVLEFTEFFEVEGTPVLSSRMQPYPYSTTWVADELATTQKGPVPYGRVSIRSQAVW